jgi:DNA-directed RNA polymerase specialized sigma24 family protein
MASTAVGSIGGQHGWGGGTLVVEPREALVGDLPPGERAAVLARVVDEQDYHEIAAALGCSEDAVRTRVSRGLARLALSAKE